jgi:hypothetical protein
VACEPVIVSDCVCVPETEASATPQTVALTPAVNEVETLQERVTVVVKEQCIVAVYLLELMRGTLSVTVVLYAMPDVVTQVQLPETPVHCDAADAVGAASRLAAKTGTAKRAETSVRFIRTPLMGGGVKRK